MKPVMNEISYEGVDVLDNLSELERFNRTLVEEISPYLKGSILEVGAGTGNLSQFMPSESGLFLSDLDEGLVDRLKRDFAHQDKVQCDRLDIASPSDTQRWLDAHGLVQSVVCMNVMEHIQDDLQVLRNLKSLLPSGGHAVVLVPQFQWLYGSYDEMVGHVQRYSKKDLQQKASSQGFEVLTMLDFNAMSIPGWWLNAVVLKSKVMPTWQLKLVDRIFPFVHQVERALDLPGMSLIAICKKL
jgi:SAM-dependent methyltransferase